MEDLARTADSTHNSVRNVNVKRSAAILLIFGCSFLYSVVYTHIPVSYHDESTRVARGYLFELFLQRDFSHPIWQTIEGFDQPMLAQLVYGAVIYPQYLKEKARTNTKDFLTYMIDQNLFDTAWIANVPSLSTYVAYQKSLDQYVYWDDYWIRNQLQTNQQYLQHFGPGFNKTLSTIYLARRINILILTLSVLIFYSLATRFFPPITSGIMALWFGTNTFVVHASLRAHNEALFTFFFLLGLMLIIQIMNQKTLRWQMVIALGITTGLCMASKLNGFMLGLIYAFVAGIKARIYTQPTVRHTKIAVLSTSAIIIMAFCLFVMLNPYTYSNPIQNTLHMYGYRYDVAIKDGILGPGSALPRLSGRVSIYYRDFFSPQRAHIFSFPYKANQIIPQHVASFFAIGTFIVGFLSFLSKKKTESQTTTHSMFLWMFGITMLIVSLYLTLYRDTYMIPLSVFVLWFEGLGVYSIGAATLRTVSHAVKTVKNKL